MGSSGMVMVRVGGAGFGSSAGGAAGGSTRGWVGGEGTGMSLGLAREAAPALLGSLKRDSKSKLL